MSCWPDVKRPKRKAASDLGVRHNPWDFPASKWPFCESNAMLHVYS